MSSQQTYTTGDPYHSRNTREEKTYLLHVWNLAPSAIAMKNCKNEPIRFPRSVSACSVSHRAGQIFIICDRAKDYHDLSTYSCYGLNHKLVDTTERPKCVSTCIYIRLLWFKIYLTIITKSRETRTYGNPEQGIWEGKTFPSYTHGQLHHSKCGFTKLT